ncbi:MAG: efflux transporter periplasmic adaptor subunit [Gemmatimonadetes bacterium]|nr:MAG: efflux transporter periplasmic adaptor subunit [Gemmatimonadota bacterium]
MGVRMKRLIRPATWTAVVAAALVLVGTAAARRRVPAAAASPPPPEVSVLTVVPDTVAARYEYVGQAAASRSVEVRSQVTGVILARPYAEGTDVAKGTLLFRIDPTTYEAAYRSAQARLANADRNLARLKSLLALRAVAQKDVDDAQQAFDQARAAADETRKDYEDTFVRAEISGRAGRAQLELGARVTGSADLLTTVEQVDPIYVNFSPSDEDMLALGRDIADGRLLLPPGQHALAVQVTLADGSLFAATGQLNFADLAVQPATGTLQLRAQLSNPHHVLLPGQFVRVRLLGLKRPRAILVPQRAVQQGLSGSFVYVVSDSGRVAARDVVATSWDGGSWLIEQGLQAGDRVVVDGVQKVTPGQPAKPVAYNPAADSAGADARDGASIARPAAPLRIRSRP